MCSIRIGRVHGFVQFSIGEGDINPEIEQEEMEEMGIFDYSLRRVVDLVAALAFQAGVRWLTRYFRSSAAAGASSAGAECGVPTVPTVRGTGSGAIPRRSGSGAGDAGSHGDPSDGQTGQTGGCDGDKPGGGDVVLVIEAES